MGARHERLRGRADKLLRRWGISVENGDATLAYLARGEPMVQRKVVILEDDYSSREIDGVVVIQGDRRYLVSSLDPDSGEPIEPPDYTQDVLVVPEESDDSQSVELRIVEKPRRLSPGTTIIYYEIHCRED